LVCRFKTCTYEGGLIGSPVAAGFQPAVTWGVDSWCRGSRPAPPRRLRCGSAHPGRRCPAEVGNPCYGGVGSWRRCGERSVRRSVGGHGKMVGDATPSSNCRLRKETRPEAVKNLCRVWSALRVAAEVGPLLGGREVLQRPLPQGVAEGCMRSVQVSQSRRFSTCGEVARAADRAG